MEEKQIHTIQDAYWITPGKLLAGGYPTAFNEEGVHARLRYLLENNITFFVNLTEEAEKGLEPYAPILEQEAAALGLTAEHHQTPIPDFNITSKENMKYILDTIDSALTKGHKVYIHCFAGIGRTGMVAACYLARHGLRGEAALDELDRLRKGTFFECKTIPTPEQREMALSWSE